MAGQKMTCGEAMAGRVRAARSYELNRDHRIYINMMAINRKNR
jgi:hypothetical protein